MSECEVVDRDNLPFCETITTFHGKSDILIRGQRFGPRSLLVLRKVTCQQHGVQRQVLVTEGKREETGWGVIIAG